MNKLQQHEVIRDWRTKRMLVDGQCLVMLDKSTTKLRDLTELERRYFYEGKVPTYRQAKCDRL